MSQNKEDLKNKIIYRASYRGTKEMDMLMTAFIRNIIKDTSDEELDALNKFVNMGDELLIEIKNKESISNVNDSFMLNIINKFRKFTL